MKPLPRQFHPRHRRPAFGGRPGTVSVAVLSATLLATVPADSPTSVFVGSAYAEPGAVAAAVPPAAAPAVAALPVPLAVAVPVAPPVPPLPPVVRPVAGLDQTQMDNAALIVKQGRAQGMPDQALVIAVATAMQESDLYNIASPAVPSSLRLPHQGVGSDHDSVGLFQQRASQGWGTVADLMDPSHAAMLFYSALSRVQGWQRMSVTAAAQAVQRSAFPGAYQKHAARAEQVVAALT
ncbi:hypothetical protein Daura_44485 [Dactylosporangium aurantiacum]|uniref:Uncharacterized protein n=1 Tax=Dactylosporangium aurantiacum TaxID=35754 RepID=A0A9Q9II21_9ACTN|nr:hypothetical protein [Dactylosporangium aurantiacum]MDG6102161.1 hypothetical protein [Dactylosporangium aurantiacum]UWZ53518.1 hypothetical protein Daura_44485 [Dactylosporangium aurantiacum]